MKTLFHKWFIENWQRKYFSLFIAIVAWFVINHSLISTKTLSNIPVKIVGLPLNKTVDGMQPNGHMTKSVSITFVGNKTALDALNPSAVEVVVDAKDKPDEWTEAITSEHLVSIGPDLDINEGVNLSFKTRKLVTEKIPIVITQPLGDPPRGYQFLDVWPYHLHLTVRGTEEVVSKLKLKDHKLTFNLNDISKAELDGLFTHSHPEKGDIVNFEVPEHWKQIMIPSLSDAAIQIDDDLAKHLRIDFVRYDLLPIETFLPVTLFFPPEHGSSLNPTNCDLQNNDLVQKVNGINILSDSLYAKGVSKLFLQVVRDMMQMEVIVIPGVDGTERLKWSVQFVNPRILEDEYVARLTAESVSEDSDGFEPIFKEIYWRNRFRNYMNRFELFLNDGTKLDLDVLLDKNSIKIAKHE